MKFLRSLRDDVLSKTKEGKELIRLYYEWSPVIIATMKSDEEFRNELKEMIEGMMLLLGTE